MVGFRGGREGVGLVVEVGDGEEGWGGWLVVK